MPDAKKQEHLPNAKTTPRSKLLGKIQNIDTAIKPIPLKDANEARSVWKKTHSNIEAGIEASVDNDVKLLSNLAIMRSLLSQRGHRRVLKDAMIDQEVRNLVKDLPKEERGPDDESLWSAYFRWFQHRSNYRKCKRTATYKMNELEGMKLCPHCKKRRGHTPSCPHFKKPVPPPPTEVESFFLTRAKKQQEILEAFNTGEKSETELQLIKDTLPTGTELDDLTKHSGKTLEEHIRLRKLGEVVSKMKESIESSIAAASGLEKTAHLIEEYLRSLAYAVLPAHISVKVLKVELVEKGKHNQKNGAAA